MATSDRLIEILERYPVREAYTEVTSLPARTTTDILWLIAETQRLRYLIGWVEEHAALDQDEWAEWEKLQEAEEPWLLES